MSSTYVDVMTKPRPAVKGDDFRDTIPFAVHRLAARAVAKATDDFAALGLTVAEARVVLVTLQHGPIRVSLIAEYTSLGLSTLSHMLGRLERAGLVRRKRVPDDARSVDVLVTAKGRGIAQRAEVLMMHHQDEYVDGFTPAEIETFRRYLQRSYERMGAITGGKTAATLPSLRKTVSRRD
jgi:DNA-binding MarR family transcriptional regulator